MRPVALQYARLCTCDQKAAVCPDTLRRRAYRWMLFKNFSDMT